MKAQRGSRIGSYRCIVFAIVLLAVGMAHASPPDESLERLMAEFWEAQVQAAPLAAALWGENRYRDRVDDLSPEALAARVARLDRAIAGLEEIDARELSPANREHYEAFEWMLTHERRNLDFGTRFFTINSFGGWHSRFADLIQATPYASEAGLPGSARAPDGVRLLRPAEHRPDAGRHGRRLHPALRVARGLREVDHRLHFGDSGGQRVRQAVRGHAGLACSGGARGVARRGAARDRRSRQPRLPGLRGLLRRELRTGLPNLGGALVPAGRAGGL